MIVCNRLVVDVRQGASMLGHASDISGDNRTHRSTGAVLEREFQGIHGEGWKKLTPQERRDVRKACRPLRNKASREERLEWRRGVTDAYQRAAYQKSIHALSDDDAPAALCLSGGGIRSAAFALGIVQGMARRGLLSKTHYLSTVSGGGYTGSWLTAWAHREALNGTPFKTVEGRIGHRAPHAAAEAEPLAWLRSHQKFLTPSAGLGSADTWAAVSIFVRDLLLNWLVFVPLLAALLLLPHMVRAGLQAWAGYAEQPCDASLNRLLQLLWSRPTCRVPWPAGWADSLGALLVSVGLVSAMTNRSTQGPHTMGDRGFGWLVLLPVVVGALLLLMQIAAWKPGSTGPDRGQLIQYGALCPVVFVVARAIGLIVCQVRDRSATPEPGQRLWVLIEAMALVPSGALVGALIWCGLWLRHQMGSDGFGDYRDLAVFGVPWLLLAFLGGQALYTGLVSRTAFGQRDQEWMARASGHYLVAGLLWVLCAGTVLYGSDLAGQLRNVSFVAAGAGTITLATALSSLTKATTALKIAKERVPVSVLVSLACLVFLLCGVVLLSNGTSRLMAWLPWSVDTGTLDTAWADLGRGFYDGLSPVWQLALLAGLRIDAWSALVGLGTTFGALLFLSLAVSLFVNVNLFSLHTLYRNRLVRTFLGASNAEPLTGKKANRNNFDGFSLGDDLRMGELWRDRDGHSIHPGQQRPGPFPVVNMTLNLLDTENLAWQDRKATSFISTPFDVGGDLVGYRDARYVASQPSFIHSFLADRKVKAANPRAGASDRDTEAVKGISLGTVMAISGAAASPNWGYHSSPLVGFVMMLFNVRLGWWLGNPNRKSTWRYDGPFLSLRLFLQEALGQTSDRHPYIYLSDGGHFDNLGLYEMVRRRCRTIIVSDATADASATLEDLGRSVRQVSIDLGVPITFECINVRKRGDGAGVYCAVGTIHYKDADGDAAKAGRILYIKPGLYDDAPADVRAYAAANAKFPHDSTANQFFSESQFESYRALGSHIIARVCGEDEGPLTLRELTHRAESYFKNAEAAAQQRLRLVSGGV